MKILFFVPENFEKVGGMYLPIQNYTDHFRAQGHAVTLYKLPYHLWKAKDIAASRHRLSKIVSEKKPDVFLSYSLNHTYILLKHMELAEYPGKKVAFLADSMQLYASSLRKQTSFGRLWLIYFAKEKLYGYKERYCLRRADDAIYVSKVDIDYVLSTYKDAHALVHYIPNGTVIPEQIKPSKRQSPLRLGCLTGFSEEIIQEDLSVIVDCIFPKIRHEIPEAKLIIAGKGASPHYIEKLNSMENVVFLGYVDKLSDFYDSVDVVLSTVKKECGILNRILEAWAYEKTVVGFGKNFATFANAYSGVHYIKADTPNEFVDVMQRISCGTIDCDTVAANARLLVGNEYTWDAGYKKLVEVLQRI